MRSVASESTMVAEGLTSERLEVMVWLRCHNPTSKCLDDERHGAFWFWMQRLAGSSWVWFDKKDGERRQDIESVTADRRWLWLEEKRVKMRVWVDTSQL